MDDGGSSGKPLSFGKMDEEENIFDRRSKHDEQRKSRESQKKFFEG